MNFAFSAEQDALRDTVRRFLDERCPSAETRRLIDTAEGFDPDVWKQATTELGLTGLHVPESLGGQGFGFVEVVVVCEELGASLAPLPYLSSGVLTPTALMQAGAGRDVVEPIATGQARAALAVTEPNGRWDASGVELRVTAGKLTGTKTYVVDGHTADTLVVAARDGDALRLFTVSGEAAAERKPLDALDLTRKLAEVTFDDTPVEAVSDAFDFEKTMQLASVALAAEHVGGAQRCLDMAVAYAKDRYQFGRPIGSFQAIKHKCADMLLDVESARSAAHYAAWAAASDHPDLPIASSLAKAYCSEAFYRCSRENIQVHGGIGFTWEHDCHLYYRRAKSGEIMFGSPDVHRDLIADRLGI